MTNSDPITSLIADFRLSAKRLKDTPLTNFEEVTRELSLNVYPSMIALAEQVADSVADVEDILGEVAEQDYLQPETATQILTTIAAAASVIELLEPVLRDLDDLKRHKIMEAIQIFQKSAEITVMTVTNSVVEDEDDEDDEDDEENIEELDTEESSDETHETPNTEELA